MWEAHPLQRQVWSTVFLLLLQGPAFHLLIQPSRMSSCCMLRPGSALLAYSSPFSVARECSSSLEAGKEHQKQPWLLVFFQRLGHLKTLAEHLGLLIVDFKPQSGQWKAHFVPLLSSAHLQLQPVCSWEAATYYFPIVSSAVANKRWEATSCAPDVSCPSSSVQAGGPPAQIPAAMLSWLLASLGNSCDLLGCVPPPPPYQAAAFFGKTQCLALSTSNPNVQRRPLPETSGSPTTVLPWSYKIFKQ